jgi:hypothetical protein
MRRGPGVYRPAPPPVLNTPEDSEAWQAWQAWQAWRAWSTGENPTPPGHPSRGDAASRPTAVIPESGLGYFLGYSAHLAPTCRRSPGQSPLFGRRRHLVPSKPPSLRHRVPGRCRSSGHLQRRPLEMGKKHGGTCGTGERERNQGRAVGGDTTVKSSTADLPLSLHHSHHLISFSESPRTTAPYYGEPCLSTVWLFP